MAQKVILAHDAKWMRNLAIAQLIYLPLTLVWRHFVDLKETTKEERSSYNGSMSLRRQA